MYVINAPTIAVKKLIERQCVVVRAIANSEVSSMHQSYIYFTVPIARILVMYKDVITIMNRDFVIPYSNTVYGSTSFGIVTAQIDFVEPEYFGNIFATLNLKGSLTYDEINFVMTMSEDVIKLITKQFNSPKLRVSTSMQCMPNDATKDYISSLEKEDLANMKKCLENGEEIIFDTSSIIPLQEVVKKVKPGYLEESFIPYQRRDPGFLYNEEEIDRQKKMLELQKQKEQQLFDNNTIPEIDLPDELGLKF